MKSLSQSEYGELRSLYESVYAPKIESIFEEFTVEDLEFDFTDEYIEEKLEELFIECIEEGYDIDEIESIIFEEIDFELTLLNEAKVTLGHDTERASRKAEHLKRIKGGVKKVGSALRSASGLTARAIGTTVRAGSKFKDAVKRGYERGRHGAEGPSSSDSNGSSGGSSGGSSDGSSNSQRLSRQRKDGLLKRAVKKVVRGAGKVASTGFGAAKAASDYIVRRAGKA